MEFNDGDIITGTYGGNEWTRRGGRWEFTGPRLEQYNDLPPTTMSDKTAEYLLGLKVVNPEPSAPKERKLSKTEPIKAPEFVYKFNLKPLT